MILDLLRTIMNGGELGGDYAVRAMVQLIALAFVLLCCLPVHEFAHAWMANRLGDQTPRLAGRLTLNPFAHLDLWGTLLILFAGVGYAKPVPVNPRNMSKGSKKGLALTALAGPVSNLIMALLFLLIANTLNFFNSGGNGALILAVSFLDFAADVNIMLASFNMLPVPPLDGFNILQAFLPYEALRFVSKYHSYVRWALLALVFMGLLDLPLGLISRLFSFVVDLIAGLPFMFFR